MRDGSTYQNMKKKKKKTFTHGSGNTYSLRSVHLFIGDVQPDVHSWHMLQEVLSSWQCIPLPFSNDDATWPYSMFPRCLPCLSRTWTHNQTSSATVDKRTDLRKYAFPDLCLLDFFYFSCFGVYCHLSKYSTLFLNSLYIVITIEIYLPTENISRKCSVYHFLGMYPYLTVDTEFTL